MDHSERMVNLTTKLLGIAITESAGPRDALGALHIVRAVVEELARLGDLADEIAAAAAFAAAPDFVTKARATAEQILAMAEERAAAAERTPSVFFRAKGGDA